MQSSYGFPLSGGDGVDRDASWAEFTSFQVRRTTTPRRPAASERSHPALFEPRIKLSAEANASAESKAVDADAVRLEKFRQRNVHGHSSDSSVAMLLYGQAATDVEPHSDVTELGPVVVGCIHLLIFCCNFYRYYYFKLFIAHPTTSQYCQALQKWNKNKAKGY